MFAPLVPLTRPEGRTIDDFDVDWRGLVEQAIRVDVEEDDFLRAVARYTSIDPPSEGIFAMRFAFRADGAFDELLRASAAIGRADSIVARFLGRTSAGGRLGAFAQRGETIEANIEEAARVMRPWTPSCLLDPFALHGDLASFLYRYGMYTHFCEDHTADQAWEAARSLLKRTVGERPEERVSFRLMGPWGAWFDSNSCSDRTFLLFQRRSRRAWLYCFSHSD